MSTPTTSVDTEVAAGRESARPVTPEQADVEQTLVNQVLASFDGCTNPRLKRVIKSLVTHLHAFICDVRLTEDEWNTAIEFLTAAGQITDDKRQEFVLLSDVLGASMQTIAVNNQAYKGATEATVFGPFFIEDAPEIEIGGDIAGGASGQPCWIEGRVTDTDGNPVPGAHRSRDAAHCHTHTAESPPAAGTDADESTDPAR